MAVTSRHVLRGRILRVLLENNGRALTRKQVLDRLRSQHESAWTEEDVTSPPSRPFETKWENNASFERANLVREGLLEAGGDGHWVLTAKGISYARDQAKQLTLIGDLSVDNRGYAELRAGQLLLNVDSEGDEWRETNSGSRAPEATVELERISDLSPSVIAAAIPIEDSSAFEYAINSKTAGYGIKEEAKLVERFAAYLETEGHEVGRFKLSIASENTLLFTDIFDVTANRLYEVKGSCDRSAIRMAIGQLLDYRRHIHPDPDVAVLLPSLPTPDLLDLLNQCGIECEYEADQGIFLRVQSESTRREEP